MPGFLNNNGGNDIQANPGNFNPRNGQQWQWIVGDYSPDEDTLSQEDGQSFNSGYLLDHKLLKDAIAWFIGYSRLGGTLKVSRWNPAYHPRNSALRCSGVSVKGMVFNGKEHVIANHQTRAIDNPVYSRYIFDLRWKQWEWDFREDADVTTEWERCLKVDPYDAGEIITVDGGQYLYVSPSNVGGINNRPVVINGPSVRLYAQRVGLRVTSWGLPAQFVLDPYNFPNNFVKAKGKVSSATFLNRPAGTMLLQTYNIRKVAQPIRTRQEGALAFNVVIEMDFLYFDPPRADPSETHRGHNLLPGIRGVGVGGWFYVKNKDTSEALYPEYDMNKLLQYRDDT